MKNNKTKVRIIAIVNIKVLQKINTVQQTNSKKKTNFGLKPELTNIF